MRSHFEFALGCAVGAALTFLADIALGPDMAIRRLPKAWLEHAHDEPGADSCIVVTEPQRLAGTACLRYLSE